MDKNDLKYNTTHEWVGVVEDCGQRIAVVGITDFALQQLTDLVYMALPDPGRRLQVGDEFGEVESVKAVSPLYSPVEGEVVAVHKELVDNLEQLGADPFGEGWIMKVRIDDSASLDHLLDRDAYQAQCANAH